MLFHEIYGSYYQALAKILGRACEGTLTTGEINHLISEEAFQESAITISAALKDGEWPLLTADLGTPLKHKPMMPLTTLQKRWLKSLLLDPRIKLFGVNGKGLEEVEPLFTPQMLCYFDRYSDGDPFEDEAYISHFQAILSAIKYKAPLCLCYTDRHGKVRRQHIFPHNLEYSSKDDKFRVIGVTPRYKPCTINMARVVKVGELPSKAEVPPPMNPRQCELVLELNDERNALERAMLHFSHLQKSTTRLDRKHYRITIVYDSSDETELLIRVMSFGPMLKVVSPQSFINLIKQRLIKQEGYNIE